jgi:hypothetical protein
MRDHLVPWKADGLRSPGGNGAQGPVSKMVDSCRHPVTTAGGDRGPLLTLKAQAASGQPPQEVALPLLIPSHARLLRTAQGGTERHTAIPRRDRGHGACGWKGGSYV